MATATCCPISPVAIHNPAAERATGWVFVGLPSAVLDVLPARGDLLGADLAPHRWVRCRGGIRVLCVGVASGRTELVWDADVEREPLEVPFEFHPSIDLTLAMPRVWYDGVLSDAPLYWAPDQPKPGESFFCVIDHSDAHQVWHVRSRHPQARLTHDAYYTVWSGQSTIDYVSHSVYGTTANDGQTQQTPLGQLWAIGHYPMAQMFAPRNGVPARTQPNADGTHAFPLATPQMFHRARRIESRGVILCAPDAARELGGLRAVWAGWDGHWLALGEVPQRPADAARDHVAQVAAWQSPQPGSYSQPRPLCQPPWSNTTGEQAGFGASALGRLVTAADPALLDWHLWNTQSYALRPTANKEPDGSPFTAAAHPRAETMGMRPDLMWGRDDRLGWPPEGQLAWIDGYVCSDDEHRDDTTLAGMIALTGCPALRQIQQDHIELGLTDVRLKLGWLSAPRAIGRMLLAWANAHWLGIAGAAVLIERTLTQVGGGSAPGIVGQPGEAKYGWNNPDGSPVLGWQPWQQAIAAIGLLAAFRATGNPTALALSLVAARAAVRSGFRDDLVHIYAVSVNGAVYPDTAAGYWTAAGARVLARIAPPDDPLLAKARAVIDAFGGSAPPPSWMQAQWWAV
jgi:hypothetical protein